MTPEQPPLPAKKIVDRHTPTGIAIYGWTEKQMREYANAAVLQERERCLAIFDLTMNDLNQTAKIENVFPPAKELIAWLSKRAKRSANAIRNQGETK